MLANKVSLSVFFFLLLFLTVSFSSPDITALLSFRAQSDTSNSLVSWVNSSDPCSGSWIGVSCDRETRRVTRLVLEKLNLTGSTRPLSQLVHLRHLSLKHNHLGNIPSLDLSPWPNLKHLYLSHNRFSGEFPAGISRLRRLQRLDLSHNAFSGKIPMAELAQLPRLLTVRLESNSFDGELGAVNLSYAYSISDFNVSGNNLSGEIPVWLSRFDASSFGGNKLLCGEPLSYNCSNPMDHNESEKVPDRKDRGLSRSAVLTTIICVAVAAVLAAIGVTTACVWRKRTTCPSRDDQSRRQCGPAYGGPKWGHEGMVVFDGCKKRIGGVSDLLSASAEMLGKGSVGTTYKVVTDGGDAVVVKRVRGGIRLGKEADWWLREIIGNLRHTNIVSLRAYHRSSQNHDDQLLLLVYDFLPNGSLHHLLHGNRGPGRTPLDWPTRLKLASDGARGLAFLHDQHHNKVKFFHGHLTSSNIIVDRKGNACLSDTGLPQLLRVPLSPLSAYTAPELVTLRSSHSTSPRKFTHKCDVYSFGVVLLELLTGKMADGVEEGAANLVKWVQGVAREEWTWEVLDVELLRCKEMEEQIMDLVQVALLCLASSPKDRPAMSVVHRMIEDIRTNGVKGRDENRSAMLMDDFSSAASSSPSSSQCTPKLVSCA